MLVGFFFFPSKTNVSDLFIAYLEKMSGLLESIFCSPEPPKTRVASQYLTADLHRIKKAALTIRLELLFHRLNTFDFYSLLNNIESSTQWMCNLMASYRWLFPLLSAEELKMVRTAAKGAQGNIAVIIRTLRKEKHSRMLPSMHVSDMIKKIIEDEPNHFAKLESSALGFYSLMFFFSKFHTDLREIGTLIQYEQKL